MIEEGDLNDTAILSGTVQETNEKGWVKFKFTLPSGHVVSSEYITQDHLKQASREWIKAVRGAYVQDVRDTAEQKRRRLAQAQESRAPTVPPPEWAAPSRELQDSAGAIDPQVTAERQIVLLSLREERLEHEVQSASEALRKVRNDLKKWRAIVVALAASEEIDDEQVETTTESGDA